MSARKRKKKTSPEWLDANGWDLEWRVTQCNQNYFQKNDFATAILENLRKREADIFDS